MKTALQLTVSAQLHKDNLIEREADKIEGLRDGCTGIIVIGHDEKMVFNLELEHVAAIPPRGDQNRRALSAA